MIELLAADWNHWPDGLSPAEIALTAATAGVNGLELGVYDTDVELAPDRLAEWRRLGEQHGVPIRMLLYSMTPERWPHGGLTSDIERDRLVQQIGTLLEIASGLGLRTVGLWPGADFPDADRGAYLTAVSQLSVLAHKAGIRIAIEPKPGTLVATVGDIATFGGEVAKADSIGVLLDIGHEFAAGRDPAPIVSTLGQRLFHVHLGDSDGDPDADLPPGRLHPLDPFLAALDSVGYDGAMSPDAYGAVASHSMTGAEALAETVQRVASYNAAK